LIWLNRWRSDHGIKTHHDMVPLQLEEEDVGLKEKNMTEAAPAHARSEGAVNPALRVFKVPPTDMSINAYCMVAMQPTTTGINPMEFIIPALDDYVDLRRSYFTMELRLRKSTNDNLVADEKLWVTNNLAYSIIKQIDLQLNGTLISLQSDTYHYKAYIENLLNFTEKMEKPC